MQTQQAQSLVSNLKQQVATMQQNNITQFDKQLLLFLAVITCKNYSKLFNLLKTKQHYIFGEASMYYNISTAYT
jgi:hypothetical protein